MADTTNDVAAIESTLQPGEVNAEATDRQADIKMRTVLADTYTFVRSNEINKTISSFTFDHYIDEAKREIKEDRVLRSASSPSTGVGTRPSKLNALAKLQQDFTNSLSQIMQKAQEKDAPKGSS